MADQIVDKVTVGIPTDELEIYEECEELRDECVKCAKRSERAEAAATEAASEAIQAAQEASAWAKLHKGYWLGDAEPDPDKLEDGVLWFKTNADKTEIENIFWWDRSVQFVPHQGLHPAQGLHPTRGGEWKEITINAYCIS